MFGRTFILSSRNTHNSLRFFSSFNKNIFNNKNVIKTNFSFNSFNKNVPLSLRYFSEQNSKDTSTIDKKITTNGFHVLPEVLKREEFLAVRARLESDSREQLSLREFHSICSEIGVNESEATKLAKSFSDSGIVFHLPESKDPLISDTVFIKPHRISNLIHAAFNVNKLFTGVKSVEEYEKLKQEFQDLSVVKKSLDDKAIRSANRWIMLVGGYLFLQAALLARLTWWEFSWDIMEPITYFISFSTAIVGWIYFALSKQEYTYENLRDRLAHKKRNKLYIQHGFNLERYNQLAAIFK